MNNIRHLVVLTIGMVAVYSAHADLSFPEPPFAPAAGLPGSTAIAHNDPRFVSWATGWENYNTGSLLSPDLEWQTPERALGAANSGETAVFDIVSLGRRGSITLTFDNPIVNGMGADFAVFENAFNDTFLELARVSVSTDGVDFVPITNQSFSPSSATAGTVEAIDIDGLAGKYRGGFGTPFDLEVLTQLLPSIHRIIPGFDLNNINYVKIDDIFSDVLNNDLDTDTLLRPIYDPTFEVSSVGFDLEALGIINQNAPPPDPDPEPESTQVPLPSLFFLALAALMMCIAGFKQRQ